MWEYREGERAWKKKRNSFYFIFFLVNNNNNVYKNNVEREREGMNEETRHHNIACHFLLSHY